MSDRARFESLFREHYPAVLRFARRRTDAATAEDVAAETFAVAWRRLERVPAEPLPWLYVVAARELSTRRRAAASDRVKASRSADVAFGRDPADALGERDAVLRAFARLSETDREALRLVAWDGLSLADGAKVAGTTRLAFAMRVSRARRRLGAALAAADDPAPPRLSPGPPGHAAPARLPSSPEPTHDH
ncbi:sigma-70 family RNA polymerase sigma factor [Solirubrobacter sp. CPCC 204708]|uniref:Sigma-70 family RNA polymerase sigma factor n=1 Tax=Solirubrobacter deserti TaxID=2282478 RepID=A0ABT4RGE1_9ACTN|nr:sigma-70 family RNA polymerase sigma factor [Solirubrobacter deserti]MBE2319659.1 sigma-70 family RNA polymerase sigma factor [Solirubrobacter deserti]MDA0137602.1 sigma-70 family RNA polymerase sigma factor [Solirubrobacter deserti]